MGKNMYVIVMRKSNKRYYLKQIVNRYMNILPNLRFTDIKSEAKLYANKGQARNFLCDNNLEDNYKVLSIKI